jgi:hypothetical protein
MPCHVEGSEISRCTGEILRFAQHDNENAQNDNNGAQDDCGDEQDGKGKYREGSS